MAGRLAEHAAFRRDASGLCGTSEARRIGPWPSSNYNSAAMPSRQQQSIIQAALAQRNAAKSVRPRPNRPARALQSKLDSAMSKLKEAPSSSTRLRATSAICQRAGEDLRTTSWTNRRKIRRSAKATKELQAAREKAKQVEERILASPTCRHS